MFRKPAHFGTDPLLTTSTNSSPPLAGTLTQRLLRLARKTGKRIHVLHVFLQIQDLQAGMCQNLGW